MNKKILVVDDDEAILDVLQIILSGENYDVETSENGKVFQNFKQLPDLVILDVLLSGEDGREIIKKLRKNSRTKNLPVIMFSAHPSAGRNLLALGANDFIAKPFEIEDLLKMVKKNLA